MSLALNSGTTVTLKNFLAVVLVSALYLAVSTLLVGFKTDQLVLIAIFFVLYFATTGTRKFILGFSIFIVYWIIFDYMKAFPNYNYSEVHIAGLYNLEKQLAHSRTYRCESAHRLVLFVLDTAAPWFCRLLVFYP
jgi:hypothetical protein